MILNEISRKISHIMSQWIKWIDYSSLQWEWRRNRVVKWIFTTMNEHDEWTKWINKMNEQNEKKWKWRKKKWWKKNELWLKKRANFTLFWSRISVLRNENNTRNENFNNFILFFSLNNRKNMGFLHEEWTRENVATAASFFSWKRWSGPIRSVRFAY